MMIRASILAALTIAALALGGCMNTMRGVGNDVKQNTDTAVKATVPRR